jgi:hypothetical protein
MLTAEQIAKLPKRVQDHIATLERRILDAKSAMDALATTSDGKEDGTYFNDYADPLKMYRKVPQERVRIVVGGHQFDFSRHEDGGIRIYFNGVGGVAAMAVRPQACNSIWLVPAPHMKSIT